MKEQINNSLFYKLMQIESLFLQEGTRISVLVCLL